MQQIERQPVKEHMSTHASRLRRVLFLGLGAALALAGCLGNSSDAPTTTPDDPADYVITPAGYYHKDCVYDVGDESTVEDGQLTHADGSVEALPSCTHASYASLEDLEAGIPRVALDEERRVSDEAQLTEPAFTGWLIADTKWASTWFRKLAATWSVPTSPSHWGGQTIYLFPAFESAGAYSLAQPVLGYGQNGTANDWTIASWWCTAMQGCPHSPFRRVNPGDIIDGVATGSSCTRAGVCTWTITARDRHTGQATTLVRRDPRPMTWVGTALEVWNLAACSELPSSGAEGFDISVQNGNGSWSNTGWGHWHANPAVNCNYRATSIGANHTYLFWNH
jgi:hypothetical protein